MIKDDVLDKLKVKEEEIEAFLERAGEEAAAVREDAFERARELGERRIKEVEIEIEAISARETEAIEAEATGIDESARTEAAALKETARPRMEDAAREVVRAIVGPHTEGIRDKRDDKGSDNRAEKVSR